MAIRPCSTSRRAAPMAITSSRRRPTGHHRDQGGEGGRENARERKKKPATRERGPRTMACRRRETPSGASREATWRPHTTARGMTAMGARRATGRQDARGDVAPPETRQGAHAGDGRQGTTATGAAAARQPRTGGASGTANKTRHPSGTARNQASRKGRAVPAERRIEREWLSNQSGCHGWHRWCICFWSGDLF